MGFENMDMEKRVGANCPEDKKLKSQTEMFANRLSKRWRVLRKWAGRLGVTAYRVYDRDIPEIPLAVDVYEMESVGERGRYGVMSFFERPYDRDPNDENMWLEAMKGEVVRVLGLESGDGESHVIVKTRRRQKGSGQYEKQSAPVPRRGVVSEGAMKFFVNLSEYLDTGLFLDHRPLRGYLAAHSKGLRVLNLFGYTGALSVAAAVGGASEVRTVDLSNTYLGWARDNLVLNGFMDEGRYSTVRSDVREFLSLEGRKRRSGNGRGYDIILLDPPTFSNSTMTEDVLDTNRDWPELVRSSLVLLNPGGTLFFSTNSRRLSFDVEAIPSSIHGLDVRVLDVTQKSIPEDFKGHRIHRCWKITLTCASEQS